MSGSTIGGVVGAVVGFYFGGPQGAQIGWMVGSAVGGYVDPEQIQGPRLQDARTQTSRDGIAIPFGWGTFPLAGNVIAQGPVVEVKKTERQGKGGPEVTSYTYTRTYAIGLCEGPIAGILQVKRNGKVVYDARTDDAITEEVSRDGSFAGDAIASIITQIRAANAKWSNKATFYLGDETQMPDPALEAIFGAGNVPAHRGLAYFVVEDDDVTDLAGAIPQYEVVVAGAGTTSKTCSDSPLRAKVAMWLDLDEIGGGTADDKASPTEPAAYYGSYTDNTGIFDFAGPRLFANGGNSVECLDGPGFDISCVRTPNNAMNAGGQVSCAFSQWFHVRSGSLRTRHCLINRNDETSSSYLQAVVNNETRKIDVLVNFQFGGPIALSFSSNASVSLDSSVHWILNKTATKIQLFINGVLDKEVPYTYELGGTPIGHSFLGAIQGDEMLDGYISQSVWFVDSLSGDEVSLMFNSGLGQAWTSLGAPSGAAPIPDAPDYLAGPDGAVYPLVCSDVHDPDKVPLSTIVASVCERRGIVADERDVSQLTDLITGFVVARETDAASIIQSLTPAYFFDPGEWDAKLRFIKRGGTAVGAINGDDLVERDGDAFERERVQEAELLRRVTVGYNDPQAAYALTTQKWERRAGTVQALGEASVELPLTLDADDAATIAKRRGLTAWGEPEKQKFSLPYRLGKYTPTDIITYTDDDGLVHSIRLMDLQDDSGVRYVESSMNSAEAYGATATGVVPRPPSISEPALRGPTLLAVMDLPLWRSSDADTLGLYVAGCGYLGGWQGAQVDVSTGDGVSYSEAAQVTIPATIGTTTTALAAWASSEYPSGQTVTVTLPDAPESVSYEALLRYNNRAALLLDDGSWEILQYQNVVANGGGSYTLSGLVRGRYATTPGAAAAGARFVLLDAAVQFVPVERHLLGETFKVRATTYGTSSDAAGPADFAFTAGASQAEWPVHGVTATRDGSDNVAVTWIGRARLGTETAPYHSANFAGYRVTYSDGQTFDVAANVTTHARSGAPASQTITVRPLNSITGAGPASTGITV